MRNRLLLGLLLSLGIINTACADVIKWEGDLEAGRYQLVKVEPDSAPPDTTIPDPPDPPDPPTDPLRCYDGYRALAAWWQGFCGTDPAKFVSNADYGAMRTNSQSVRYLAGGDRFQSGYIAFEVYFATDRVPQGTGGLHICSPTSAHKALNSAMGNPYYKGWLRNDFQVYQGSGAYASPNAELRIGTYNADGNGARWGPDVVVDTWRTGVLLEPKRWIPIRFEWRRNGDRFAMKVNAAGKTITISPTSYDIYGFTTGNMDGLSNYGGIPEVRFRNLRWGRL